MSSFVWKHATTADNARRLIQMKLSGAGVGHIVSWDGNKLSASVGWGLILKVIGEVTDDALRLDHVSGGIAKTVIAKSREELASLFPGGYEVTVYVGVAADR